jgi:chromodomain-helicase-DNA-binding protein 1
MLISPCLQRRLKSGTGQLGREEKLAVLKECLATVGKRIETVVAARRAKGEDAEKWRKHCWV